MKLLRVLGVGDRRGAPIEGKRRFGVPPGGAWDGYSAAVTRALAGLEDDVEVFELLNGLAEFAFEESGTFAVCGVGDFATGRKMVEAGSHASVRAHCAYLCFSPEQRAAATIDWAIGKVSTLRYLPTNGEIERNAFEVSRSMSRHGVRFLGARPSSLAAQPSVPCCLGAIQRTPSGELIVIGPDGPTVGGYELVGAVIGADLPKVPYLHVGQEIELQAVKWTQARLAAQDSAEELDTMLDRIRSIR